MSSPEAVAKVIMEAAVVVSKTKYADPLYNYSSELNGRFANACLMY